MEERREELHAFRDPWPRTAEVSRRVHHERPSRGDRPWCHGTERGTVAVGVGMGRRETEAARHDDEHVGVEPSQMLPHR